MKKILIAIGAFFLLCFGIGFCIPMLPQQKDTSPSVRSTPFVDKTRFQVNETQNCGGLEVTIGDIRFNSEKIEVKITAINRTNNVLGFFPDQKSIVIGKNQIDANAFMGDGKISGEINAGVEKNATIVYADKNIIINPADVKEMELHFGDVTDMKTYKTKPCDFTLSVINK